MHYISLRSCPLIPEPVLSSPQLGRPSGDYRVGMDKRERSGREWKGGGAPHRPADRAAAAQYDLEGADGERPEDAELSGTSSDSSSSSSGGSGRIPTALQPVPAMPTRTTTSASSANAKTTVDSSTSSSSYKPGTVMHSIVLNTHWQCRDGVDCLCEKEAAPHRKPPFHENAEAFSPPAIPPPKGH